MMGSALGCGRDSLCQPSWASRQTIAVRDGGSASGPPSAAAAAADFASRLASDARSRASLSAQLALPQGSQLHSFVDLLSDAPPQRSSTAACLCGVSLDFLLRFASKVPPSYTTADVCYQVIKPITEAVECRLTDLIPQQHVQRPNYFISHRWGYPFQDLVATIRDELSGAVADRVFVWLDICAVNQHPGYTQDDLPELETAIRLSQGVLVIMDSRGLLLTRIWCLYELWTTITVKGHSYLRFITRGFSASDIRDVYSTLDASRAEATVDADRVKILADIERSVGIDKFNRTLKLLFLLDPMDIGADVSSILSVPQGSYSGEAQAPLACQAAGVPPQGISSLITEHDRQAASASGAVGTAVGGPVGANAGSLGAPAPTLSAQQGGAAYEGDTRVHDAFREWLCLDSSAQGYRALAVYGPAGCGKSFAAAQLSRLPDIDASHFCRMSDQRSQDPLACIRSLAYQLAIKSQALQTYYARLSREEVVGAVGDAGAAVSCLLERALAAAGALGDMQEGPEQGSKLMAAGGDGASERDAASRAQAGYQAGEAGEGPGEDQEQPQAELKAEDPSPKQVVILLDGLDEGGAGRAGGNALLVLLREHLSRLPTHVRFVVFCNPDATIHRVLTYSLKPTELQLGDGNSPRLQAWCCARIATAMASNDPAGKLADGLLDEAASVLVDRSKGSLLYTLLAVQLLHRLRPAEQEPRGPGLRQWLDTLPVGLPEMFEHFLTTCLDGMPEEQFFLVHRLLNVLVAARVPLTLQQLHKMGIPSEALESQLCPKLKPLICIRDCQVTLLHRSFYEWLTQGDTASHRDQHSGLPSCQAATASLERTPEPNTSTSGIAVEPKQQQQQQQEQQQQYAHTRSQWARVSVCAGHEALAQLCMEDLQDSLAASVPGDGANSRPCFDSREPQRYSLRYALVHMDRAAAMASASLRGTGDVAKTRGEAVRVGSDQGADTAASGVAAGSLDRKRCRATALKAWFQLERLVTHLGYWQRVYQSGLGAAVLIDLTESFCFRGVGAGAVQEGSEEKASSATGGDDEVEAAAKAAAAVRAAVQWLRLNAALHAVHPESVLQTAANMHRGSLMSMLALSSAQREPCARCVNPPRQPSLLLAEVSGHLGGGYYTCVGACAPAGVVVAGDHHGNLYIHSLFSGTKIMKVRAHARQVKLIAFVPGAELLVSLATDNTLNTTDTATGQTLGTLFGHTAQVSCIAVAPNGRLVASASVDGQLVTWDILQQRKIMTFWLIPPRPAAPRPPVGGFTPPGAPPHVRPAAFGQPAGGRTGPLASMQQAAAPVEEPCALSFATSSKLLAAGTSLGWVYVLNAESLQVVWKAPTSMTAGPGSPITCLAFSPDDEYLACGTHQYNHPSVSTYSAQSGSRLSVSSSPARGTVADLLWPTAGSSASRLRLQAEAVTAAAGAAANPAPRREAPAVAVNICSTLLSVWSPAAPHWPGRALLGHLGPVQGAALLQQDGQGPVVVSCAQDATIRLWSAPLPPPGDPEANADGSQVSPVGDDNQGHTALMQSLGAAGDGRLLLSGGHDGFVRLWDPFSGAAVGKLATKGASPMLVAATGAGPGSCQAGASAGDGASAAKGNEASDRHVVVCCTADTCGMSQLMMATVPALCKRVAGRESPGEAEPSRQDAARLAVEEEMVPVGEQFEGRIAALTVALDGQSVAMITRTGVLMITALPTGSRQQLTLRLQPGGDCQTHASVGGTGDGGDGDTSATEVAGEQAPAELAGACFSPDLRRLAVVASGDGARPDDQGDDGHARIQVFHLWCSVSPLSPHLHLAGTPDERLTALSACEAHLPLSARGGARGVELGWSPSGELLVAWVRDGPARVWNVGRDGPPQLLASITERTRHCSFVGESALAVYRPSGPVQLYRIEEADGVDGTGSQTESGLAGEAGVRPVGTMYATAGCYQCAGDGHGCLLFVPPVGCMPHIYRFSIPLSLG